MASAAASSGGSDRADELRLEGNKAFKAKHFDKAIDFYSQAIDIEASAPLYGE